MTSLFESDGLGFTPALRESMSCVLGQDRLLLRPDQTEAQVENLRLLVSPFGHDLRALALNCDDFSVFTLVKIKIKSTQLIHRLVTQCKLTQVLLFTSSNEFQCAQQHLNGFFDNLCALASRLTSPFGQPTHVCTQVQLETTCVHLRYRLLQRYSPSRQINWSHYRAIDTW